MGDEQDRLPQDEAWKVMDRILKEGIVAHADAIAPICAVGDIAVVVFELDPSFHEGVRQWGWDGSCPVFRLSNARRKNAIRYFRQIGDTVSANWFERKQDERIFLFNGPGSSLLINFKPGEGYSLEPGSLDANAKTWMS